jgi:glycine dehydrogenase subunit 1
MATKKKVAKKVVKKAAKKVVKKAVKKVAKKAVKKVAKKAAKKTTKKHIRRAKATSNICTNTGLVALGAAIYLAAMGKQGFRRAAELSYHKAHYAAQQIDALPNYRLVSNKPFFKEFVIECPHPVAEINRTLLQDNIIGGLDLAKEYAHLENHMLVCVTEMNTRKQIDKFVQSLAKI